MPFIKTILHRFSMPYALGTMVRNNQNCVVCATEDEGPIVVSAPPYTAAEILVPGPGGCLSLVSDPENPGELYAIMGCFLGYKFHGGALYRVDARGPRAAAAKLADLPFGHRMDVVRAGGQKYILMANLAATKETPEDWKLGGTVYALPLGPSGPSGSLVPVYEGIHKNHGFLKTTFQGRSSVFFSGEEGLFLLDLDSAPDSWKVRSILPYEVSEIAVCDLDGDGQDELVTIEPFHGPKLSVYKEDSGRWSRVWEAELAYGHGLLAQEFQGRPSILVSNRAGSKDLVWYPFEPSGTSPFPNPKPVTIDTGVGAANLLVHQSSGEEFLFAANQTQGEFVRYHWEK